MVVSILSGDLLTGRVWGRLPVADGSVSWAVEHRAEGSVEATIPLRGEVLDRFPGMVQELAPWRTFLAAVTDGGQVLQAGPIRPHKYSDTTGDLQVGASGLRAYFARRFLHRHGGGRVQDQELTWSGLSLGTIAKRIVQETMAHPGGDLPIDLPPDEAGTHTRTYYGFELARVSERLKQIEDVQNGPDIAFEPYLTEEGRFLRWRMRVGTSSDPELHQDGPDHVWDRTVPHTPIEALDVDVDPDEMGDGAWAVGSGMDTEILIARDERTGLRARGYPLLEVDESRNSVLVQATLEHHARALARRSQRPWQTWTMTVRADVSPTLGTYRVGDYARVHVGRWHPYIPARSGYYRTRIVGISGDQTRSVALTLAPTLEDR